MPDYSHEANLPKKELLGLKFHEFWDVLSLDICGDTVGMSVGIICHNVKEIKFCDAWFKPKISLKLS